MNLSVCDGYFILLLCMNVLFDVINYVKVWLLK